MLQRVLPTTRQRYTLTAMAFHWVLAIMITVAFAVGVYLSGLEFSPAKVKTINYHKWAGIAILFLSMLRLLWRLSHRPPGLPPSIESNMPAWQRVAHHATHHLLYVLFFAVPLLGWAYSSARGFPIVWFGVVPLPDFVPVDKALADSLKEAHGWAAYGLAGLVVLHVLAAFKHQWINRDSLIARMLPGNQPL